MEAQGGDAATAVERIATWAAGLSDADIPAPVRAVARTCLIDTLGVAIAGCRREAAGIARGYVQATCAPGRSHVLGASLSLAPAGAAFANATTAHVLDFDDNCYAGSVHGSAVVVPAALAVAESVGLSGASLVTSLVAGVEAEYAIGDAATPALYGKGWWTTGLLGPIGATVAASRALSLDAPATAHALGLAVAGSGGIKACFGTDAKPLLCGRASEAGVVAASLAAAGASGPAKAFEESRGFARLFNDGTFDAGQLSGLGRRWRLLDPGIDIKRIPVCLSSHAAVDALIELLAEQRIDASEVELVTCDVTPGVVANLAHARPSTVQEAQFSMPFAVACVLVFGDVALHHLADAVIADPRIRAAMGKVEMHSGPRWADAALVKRCPEGACVTVRLRDGRSLERFRGSARGTAAHPLAPRDVEAKFLSCAAPVIGDRQGAHLLERLQNIEALASAGNLFATLNWNVGARS